MIAEFTFNIKFNNDSINLKNLNSNIARFIDSILCKDEVIKDKHYDRIFKEYSFNFPILKDRKIDTESTYSFKLRTMNSLVINQLLQLMGKNYESNNIVLVNLNMKMININKNAFWLRTLTPTLVRRYEGYWRTIEDFTTDDLITALENNIRKKFKQVYGRNLSGSIIDKLAVSNNYPISIEDHSNTYLCDKYNFKLSKNKEKQNIIKLLFALGFGERNARGLGFIEYIPF